MSSARDRARELARRLNLLMDTVASETGTPFTFEQVAERMHAEGINLSRGRWYYMLSGEGALTEDLSLLRALSRMFGVPDDYLLADQLTGLPDRIDSQLELVRALRASKINSFAARTLGPLSPEGTRELAEAIDREMARQLPKGTADRKP